MAGGISPDDGIGLIDDVTPRNIGAVGVDAFRFAERELPTGRGLNDSISTAELLPLGTLAGKQNTIDVTGTLPLGQTGTGLTGNLPEDSDYFAFDLQAGDILDIAGLGSVGEFDVFYANGRRWFAVDTNQVLDLTVPTRPVSLYPASSPLQTLGNAVLAQVVPDTGRYFVRLASSGIGTNYTLGLRVYRPVLEQQAIGTRQKVFLDFDGATLAASEFTPGLPGTIRVPSLADSITTINLQPRDESRLIDLTVAEVKKQFASVGLFGTNGAIDVTGIAGQFGVEVLNSRDNPDPGNDPFTTRILIGGTAATYFLSGLLGLAQSIDIGNFDPSESVFVTVESFEAPATSAPISNSASVIEAISTLLATVVTHEAAHTFGLRHTNSTNLVPSIIDSGGAQSVLNGLGVGRDGIFGTEDDIPIIFPDSDQFEPAEGIIGNERVAASLAWVLSTGKVGSALTGTVFNDVNRDGRLGGSGEVGLAGVTVFVDRDNDGVLDAGEISTVTGSGGGYSLAIGAGTVRIVAATPTGFVATTSAQTVTVGTGAASNVNFGFSRVTSDITGTKWADLDGNGFQDAGEPGLGGVYIYLDLDGDDRIDLGEPRAITSDNGNYTITFPGPGTYSVREVVAPGFIQTFPANGEHVVVFNGTTPVTNLNFGNLPSLDFADAPDSYQTTLAAGGPSHGLLGGLSLGGAPDRELDGKPSTGADGDDVTGLIGGGGVIGDDEDGVRLLTPIGPGANATFEVSLTNTTGLTGYLQAWFDFNRDGDFTDAGEKVITDAARTPGVNQFVIPIPSSVTPGGLYTRFRYSLTQGLGVGGQADAGEVEDHLFSIQATSKVANDDTVQVTRNSQANKLDKLLLNDFETATSLLRITSIDRFSQNTRGVVEIAQDGRSILYTPPVGFVGLDTFMYTVTPPVGPPATATVTVNVTFLSNVPIALDDTFDVAQGSSNIALNVLDNDVTSRLGGITIISVTPGTQGGQTSLAGGNQSVRYTPRPGFNGTEEFIYSISDAAGNVSSAKATINLQPGARNDDLVAFSVSFFDVVNNRRIDIENGEGVKVGQEFFARVTVEDLRAAASNTGLFSAFIDLLYTDELVSVIPKALANDGSTPFNFDIKFGPEFQSTAGLTQGDAETPGLFNEVGSQRPFSDPPPTRGANEGPIELFTIRLRAVAPGIAVFTSNPADVAANETTLFNSQTAVTVAQQRLGFAELVILPGGTNVTSAVDDSFPSGVDSLGVPIVGGRQATLNVIGNDNLGLTGVIDEFIISKQPNLGSITIGPNNTVLYTPDGTANGFDFFSYTIVTADGVGSSAQVTLTVGDAASDDELGISLQVVDGNNNPIVGDISPGSRFGLQVIVDDLRGALAANPLGVFAAYADILYSKGIIAPSDTISGDGFNFDVVFGPFFGNADGAGFGVADRPGIIDEFGSALRNLSTVNNPALTGAPVLLATLYFNAIGTGPIRFTAGPADSLPLHESLLAVPDDAAVPLSKIRYGTITARIGLASVEGEARHNALLPADVNDDGKVSPMDALTVINELSRARRAEGEGGSVLASSSKKFTDVSGDGKVTALDALKVINVIAQRNRAAQFALSQPIPVAAKAISAVPAVQLLEVKGQQVSAASIPPYYATKTLAEGLSNNDHNDSDQDDVVDLLARDISTVWQ